MRNIVAALASFLFAGSVLADPASCPRAVGMKGSGEYAAGRQLRCFDSVSAARKAGYISKIPLRNYSGAWQTTGDLVTDECKNKGTAPAVSHFEGVFTVDHSATLIRGIAGATFLASGEARAKRFYFTSLRFLDSSLACDTASEYGTFSDTLEYIMTGKNSAVVTRTRRMMCPANPNRNCTIVWTGSALRNTARAALAAEMPGAADPRP